MAFRPISRPDPFDPSGLNDGPIFLGGNEQGEFSGGRSLRDLATAAAIAMARGNEIVWRATTGANAPDLGVQLDVHSGLSGACVQSKQWQRCDDSESDSRVDAEVCRGLGVRSILVFPVMREDELLGVFEVFSPRPHAFSDREIQTLQALSRSIV